MSLLAHTKRTHIATDPSTPYSVHILPYVAIAMYRRIRKCSLSVCVRVCVYIWMYSCMLCSCALVFRFQDLMANVNDSNQEGSIGPIRVLSENLKAVE
jgi:hypothetical protein